MICKALSQADFSAMAAILSQYPELNWTPQMLESSLQANQNKAFGLFSQDTLVSFSLFQIVQDEAELLLILTHQAWRQKGCATQLLTDNLAQFDVLFLEVRAHNHAAQKLYEKLGFEFQGLRKQYYTNPLEDARQYTLYKKIKLDRT